MLTYPHIDPTALAIGPLRIHWYGVMYLVAFSAAWALARRRAAQPGSTWSARAVDDFIFYAMLGTILGGRLGYVLFYGQAMWRADPWYPLKLWDVADFAAPLPGIGILAVRIGNFINGGLWGKPTDGWW